MPNKKIRVKVILEHMKQVWDPKIETKVILSLKYRKRLETGRKEQITGNVTK